MLLLDIWMSDTINVSKLATCHVWYNSDFSDILDIVSEDIQNASFFALDTEMTGDYLYSYWL